MQEETDHISESQLMEAWQAGFDRYPGVLRGLQKAIKEKILRDAFVQGWLEAGQEERDKKKTVSSMDKEDLSTVRLIEMAESIVLVINGQKVAIGKDIQARIVRLMVEPRKKITVAKNIIEQDQDSGC